MNLAKQSHIALTDLQQAFQSAILDLQKTPPDFIVNTGGISCGQRFNVYTEAYRLRLLEALSADYPALKDYLGDDDFNSLGRAYINALPSDHYSIRWFGRHLPLFLKESALYNQQPGLTALATFEWALSIAFDAADCVSTDHHQLAAIEPSLWPLLRLHFHPSLRRINLHYNAPQVWQAFNQNNPLPAFLENQEKEAWIIWRHKLKLLYRSLTFQEAFCLDAFMQGQCFSEVCTGLCVWVEEDRVALNAASFLQAWVRDGWIVDVDTIADD
jgi:hypothetical protein